MNVAALKEQSVIDAMGTSALRKHAREVFGRGSWTAFAVRGDFTGSNGIFAKSKAAGKLVLPTHLAQMQGMSVEPTSEPTEPTSAPIGPPTHHLSAGSALTHSPAASEPPAMAVKATLTMHEDTGKAATLAALGTLQAALQASVTQAQVLDLIEQALGGAEVEERVRAAVEAAVQALPPVAFKFGDNAPVKLQGRAHVKAARLAAYMARCTPVLVKGPAGSGKTTSVCEIARMAGYEVFLVTPSMTRYDVLGYQDANGHQVETQVTRFAQHEGDACLVLDEVDGWADGAQLAANTLLANLRVVLSKGEVDVTFDGKHRKMFVATANTWGLGANAQYVGRKPLDEAFRNRFVAKLDWPYDEEFERELALARLSEGATSEQRANAGRAVGVVQKARAYVDSKGIRLTISPRQTFEVVRGLEAGDSMGTLFREVVLGGATEEQMRDVAAHVGVTL